MSNPDRVIVMVIIICLGAIVFLNNKYRQLQSPTSNQPDAKPPGQTQLISPSQADWKTYKNDQFEFYYPSGLTSVIEKLNKNNEGNYTGGLFLQNFDMYNRIPSDRGRFQMVIFLDQDTGSTLEDVADKANATSLQKMEVDGEDALKGLALGTNQPTPTVWVKHQGLVYSFLLEIPGSTNASWYDVVLSTFKFREPAL